MSTITIEPVFNIGDIVFLIHDDDQLRRQVTSIALRPGGSMGYVIIYGISCLDVEQWVYDFELSNEKRYGA